MKKYEIMYILRAELNEEERKAEMEGLHKVLTATGGQVLSVDTETFGLREFAYPINDLLKGFYVVINVETTVEALNEFERVAKFNTKVIRHLVVVKS